MDITRETYDQIGADWHRDHQHDDWWVEGTDAFIDALPSGALVLDAGCGSGVKSRYLAKHGLKIIGIDFSETLIGIAKREVHGAEFRVMNMRDAPLLAERFDGVFAQASLLHIPRTDMQLVVQGLASRLKPEGYFYVAVKGARPGDPLEEVKEENDYGYYYRRFFSYFAPQEVESYLVQAGLAVVYRDVRATGNTEWIQVIGRKP